MKKTALSHDLNWIAGQISEGEVNHWVREFRLRKMPTRPEFTLRPGPARQPLVPGIRLEPEQAHQVSDGRAVGRNVGIGGVGKLVAAARRQGGQPPVPGRGNSR